MVHRFAALLFWFVAAASAQDEADASPVRLQDLLGESSWLRLQGEVRLRWEGIDGQFRAAARLDDNDHFAVMRTRLRADAELGPLGATLEVMDARHFGAGEGSVMNRAIVNPIDFLQGNLGFDLGDYGELRVGRMTMDYGSRRMVANNRFRNTVNAFDGVRWSWHDDGGAEAGAFWTLPVTRLPIERQRQLDNELELDDQDLDNQFYGGFVGIPLGGATHLELYAYILDERKFVSLARELYTPGVRVKRAAAAGRLDFELEAVAQFGDSALLVQGPGLDHEAWFGHASIGYTFDAPWRPRVRVAYDYASGDRDPNDGDNNRFDTLFGARRFEFGPTSIYGAIARANLSSPELRLTARPGSRTRVMTALRGIWLAAARDSWVPAGVRDPTGNAGRHVGTQVEVRVRYDLVPDSVRLEVGAAYLFAGRFQRDAPNGRGSDTVYGYVQGAWDF